MGMFIGVCMGLIIKEGWNQRPGKFVLNGWVVRGGSCDRYCDGRIHSSYDLYDWAEHEPVVEVSFIH